ncbi:MAG: beta-ketoacyl-[acyl-carrier-protein] synthase family protein [Planctomycetales bacterium]
MRIPITGMSWTTALGDDLRAVWERLLRAESGMAPVAHTARLRNSLAGAVPSISEQLPPGERMLQMGRGALQRVLDEAGCRADDPQLHLVVGTSLGAYLEGENDRRSLSAWADNLAANLGMKQPPVVVSTACSSGSDAILIGAELIRSGGARRCVCGGVDILTLSKRLAHTALGTMSPTILRAFDIRHDGTLLGEGAAFVMLDAEPASAPPIGYLRGCGAANDATGMTAADAEGRGAQFAIQRSLADAGLDAQAIDLVNAHGSGTPMNDATERAGFARVFGKSARPLVFATKGNFGHTLGATGAIETVALLLALQTGQVPPVYGLEQPDPEFDLPLAYPGVQQAPSRIGLNLTLGFGGFDTSLILEGVAS